MAADKKSGAGNPGSGATIEGVAEEVKKKKRISPMEFLRQVRVEAIEKVTWTTRNETMVSTMMVIAMVIIMAIFFLLVDQTIKFGVCNLLPINCAAQSS